MIEVFRRKKRFFLVFEYLEHTVLEELEARSGGLGFVTSRKYCYQVLRALDFIHSHDVGAHRNTQLKFNLKNDSLNTGATQRC